MSVQIFTRPRTVLQAEFPKDIPLLLEFETLNGIRILSGIGITLQELCSGTQGFQPDLFLGRLETAGKVEIAPCYRQCFETDGKYDLGISAESYGMALDAIRKMAEVALERNDYLYISIV